MKTFVSIGAGNVAWHFCRSLTDARFRLLQVYSRGEKNASALAGENGCEYTTSLNDIIPIADFYIIAVKDDTISDVLEKLTFSDRLVMHTSGSTGLEVFSDKFQLCGVMYPLQTLSKLVKTDMSKVPLLCEGVNERTAGIISGIAASISSKVRVTDSMERKMYHIAAVFASNFTNHMFTRAHDLLESEHLDYELLAPLIEETCRKSLTGNPADHQTGPARRGDEHIIGDHIKLLSKSPVLQKLYTFISRNIQDYYSKNKPDK